MLRVVNFGQGRVARLVKDSQRPPAAPVRQVRQAGPFPPPRRMLSGFPEARIDRPKTPRAQGGGLRKRWRDREGRIYEWDYQHGTVEVYDRQGRHIGEFDPFTGEQLKDRNPDYRVEP